MPPNISCSLGKRLNKLTPNKLVALALCVLVFALFFLPPRDPDLGWQLRCGQEILLGKGFCSQNHFSALLPNYSWPNHHWLYQIMAFSTYQAGGFWGLTVLNAVVMSLGFIVFYLAIKGHSWEKAAAFLFSVFVGWGTFGLGLRSQELGVVYFCLMLLIVAKASERPRLKLLLPLVMLVWANSHGSFTLGLVLIAFFTPVMLVPAILATLINPHGFQIYQEVWRHFAGVDLSQLIAEWTPPVPGVFALIALFSCWLAIYFLTVGKTNRLRNALLIGAFALLALKANRHVPYVFLLAVFLILQQKIAGDFSAGSEKIRRAVTVLACFAILMYSSYLLHGRYSLAARQNGSVESYCLTSWLSYPCEAIDYLREMNEGGIIYNRYEWGGYLIWQLPDYKVFVDGRMPAWPTPSGKSPYTIYLETLQNQPGWQDTLKEYNVSWLLISPGTFMDLLIGDGPEEYGYTEVKRGNQYVLYKRL
ncbi:TPA: hypothetical protein DCY43_00535 [candidate division WWE3 bacterium]|uniref:Glycosyltransferase RgtA/B/C/D-like domain-containing protein n=4 Tax=Bacteria candidate phyla TaxID=1783234 RepID=A0A1F4V8N8_UNCKA|nr:MAG: hypothetical protein A2709_00620 [candidate division WWE3 bacterium RIFCSPHIGHO2_01_FULL_43_9]HAZ29229.1 hypothetical protein [candidate division WWE3 bacterium]